jgi:hypothetical protein
LEKVSPLHPRGGGTGRTLDGVMRFSDWQLNRLRDALRAYHKFGRDAVDGRHYNWKDVSEAIFLSTEVEVPPERLRQFV